MPVVAYDSADPVPDAHLVAEPPDHVVLVLDGEVIEAGPPRLAPAGRESLTALASASGLDLFEVHLAEGARGVEGVDEGALALRSVTSLVAMSRFGDVGLDALGKALVVRSRVRGGPGR
jgi:hypothetical protein